MAACLAGQGTQGGGAGWSGDREDKGEKRLEWQPGSEQLNPGQNRGLGCYSISEENPMDGFE